VRSYYLSITLIDLPISTLSCLLFSVIIYIMVGWPMEMNRFTIFFIVSLLIVLVAQTIGLLIGAIFNVIVS
jgi:ABC-2 type transporter